MPKNSIAELHAFHNLSHTASIDEYILQGHRGEFLSEKTGDEWQTPIGHDSGG